jgi:hypothetical protein
METRSEVTATATGATSGTLQECRLIVEHSLPSAERETSLDASRAESGWTALALPAAPMVFDAAVSDGSPIAPFSASRTLNSSVLILEPVMGASLLPRLLAVAPEGSAVRINGLPAARLSLLRAGDRLQWRHDRIVHVALFNHEPTQHAGAHRAGKPCGICRATFAADALCYACVCGAAYHFDPAGPLNCAAMLTECSVCGRGIQSGSGYESLPEGCPSTVALAQV